MATAAPLGRDFDDFRREFGDDAVRERVLAAAPTGADSSAPIKATPYRCKDPRTIPLRPWVYGRQLLRGSLSLVVAPGATGKTALLAGTALALVTGRSLLDKQVWDGPKRVWLWNLEDSMGELERLIEAARLHWGIAEDGIGDRLFVDSGLEGAGLCIAVEDRSGFTIRTPVVAALTEELLERKIDVLVVDPFVSSHSVSENNNGAIDAVAKQWAGVGVKANCSIVLVHHTKKLAGAEATAEQARGAIALVGAARSVIALNKMTTEEATGFGIVGEERRRFFRAYDDKNNRVPPADKSDWYQLLSVDLGNGANGEHGDSIQVVAPWTPPDAFTGVTVAHLQAVQGRVAEGSYRRDPQSPEWVGLVVGEVLGLAIDENRKGPEAARVKKLLCEWVRNGSLLIVKRKDQSRRERDFVEMGEAAVADAPL